MIDLLVKHYPGGLFLHDNNGLLPIHTAISTQAGRDDVSIVRHLITKMDCAILPSTRDSTPLLFLACEEDAQLDLILLLAQHSQELFLLDEPSDRGGKPIHARDANQEQGERKRIRYSGLHESM